MSFISFNRMEENNMSISFNQKKYCDFPVKLQEEDELIYCSKFILATTSDYFATMFSTELPVKEGPYEFPQKFKPILFNFLKRLHYPVGMSKLSDGPDLLDTFTEEELEELDMFVELYDYLLINIPLSKLSISFQQLLLLEVSKDNFILFIRVLELMEFDITGDICYLFFTTTAPTTGLIVNGTKCSLKCKILLRVGRFIEKNEEFVKDFKKNTRGTRDFNTYIWVLENINRCVFAGKRN